MKSDEFIKFVTPLLKEHGFRKTRATWRKDLGESIAVFNIQKSQWDSDDFYINSGLYYHAIGDEKSPTEYRCHIRNRIEIVDPGLAVDNAMKWFNAAALFKEAKILAETNSREYFAVKIFRDANIT